MSLMWLVLYCKVAYLIFELVNVSVDQWTVVLINPGGSNELLLLGFAQLLCCCATSSFGKWLFLSLWFQFFLLIVSQYVF